MLCGTGPKMNRFGIQSTTFGLFWHRLLSICSSILSLAQTNVSEIPKMPPPSLHLCSGTTIIHRKDHLGFNRSLSSTDGAHSFFPSLPFASAIFPKPSLGKLVSHYQNKPNRGKERTPLKGKNKDNVWSVDNELSSKEKQRATRRGQKGRSVFARKKRSRGGVGRGVMVSGAMLMEVETVLQTEVNSGSFLFLRVLPFWVVFNFFNLFFNFIKSNTFFFFFFFSQEPVIKPVWNTFASSVSGIWKGVGAVFSPITAKIEPIEIGNRNENLYDCYTLSCVEAVPSSSGGRTSQIQRKINWVTLNPYGEMPQNNDGSTGTKEDSKDAEASSLPKFESFDFDRSDVMEEDIMGDEPGLVFFEVRFNRTIF